MFNLPGYSIRRNDRRNRGGGGVAVWIKDSIKLLPFAELSPSPNCCECVFLSFDFARKKFILCSIYAPPALRANDSVRVLD